MTNRFDVTLIRRSELCPIQRLTVDNRLI